MLLQQNATFQGNRITTNDDVPLTGVLWWIKLTVIGFVGVEIGGLEGFMLRFVVRRWPDWTGHLVRFVSYT